MTKRRIPAPTDVPPPATPITVVGDVHLTPEEPDVARRFATFLEDVSAKGGTLVLLGDLFDWWVGRKQAVHRHLVGIEWNRSGAGIFQHRRQGRPRTDQRILAGVATCCINTVY